MTQKQSIASAPRDGSVIWVGDPDAGEFAMYWDAAARNLLLGDVQGLWVALCGGATWSEHDGFGPTYWRSIGNLQ